LVIISTASPGMPLTLAVKTLSALVAVDEVACCVPGPWVGCLDGEGGVCLPVAGGHRDGQVVKRRAQVIEAVADDHRDHRVGLLGHLQPQSGNAHPSHIGAMAYIVPETGELSTTAVTDSYVYLVDTARCVILAGHAFASLLTDTSLADAVTRAEAALGIKFALWQCP
jgi:hypothetical protein